MVIKFLKIEHVVELFKFMKLNVMISSHQHVFSLSVIQKLVSRKNHTPVPRNSFPRLPLLRVPWLLFKILSVFNVIFNIL